MEESPSLCTRRSALKTFPTVVTGATLLSIDGCCESRPTAPEQTLPAINIDRLYERARLHALFGNPRQYLERHRPLLPRTFGAPRVHTCIDEGCLPVVGDYATYSAGAGILHPDQETLADDLRTLGVRRIAAHEDCGANAVYVRERGLHGPPDTIGQSWAERFAKRIGNGTNASPITTADLQRPVGLHTALAAYYIGGRRGFDPRRADLPPGFKISRALTTENDGKAQLHLAGDIALHHGFGERMQAFHVIALGNGKDFPADDLLTEARDVVNELNHELRRNVFRLTGIDVT